MVTQQDIEDIGRAGPSHGSQGLLVQHPYPCTLSWLSLRRSLEGQVGTWERPGAVQLGVLGRGPGQSSSPDSIYPGRDGQLVSTHHSASLTTALDAANTISCGSCDGRQPL